MSTRLPLLVLTIALAAVAAMGQAPTLRIVQTDGPNLPADLYYGTTKVKPLRLRPGTNQVITIDDSDFFVNQHYVDFLSRFPDQGGFDYWTGQIASCGTKVGVVDRVEGGAIKLTKNDSPDGQHHFVPTGWVDRVDNHVHLKMNSKEAELGWKSDAASCGCGG